MSCRIALKIGSLSAGDIAASTFRTSSVVNSRPSASTCASNSANSTRHVSA